MKQFVFLLGFLLCASLAAAQQQISTDTIAAPASADNIYNKPLASDSLASSFLIVVKKEVKKHKHLTHSETVYVIEGEAEMLLGDKTIAIKKGDVIFIPKNIVHAVTKVKSKKPLKIVSVQAPYFDGKDRVMVE